MRHSSQKFIDYTKVDKHDELLERLDKIDHTLRNIVEAISGFKTRIEQLEAGQ